MGPPVDHQSVEIESFQESDRSGVPGKILLRPAPGQKFPVSLRLEGNKSLINDYPVGTRFKVQASLASRPSGAQYLFTSWQWDCRVLWRPGEDEAA